MTVFIYVNTSKQVGDADHLKVFANVDAAEKMVRRERSRRRRVRIRGSGMNQISVPDQQSRTENDLKCV
jgi:hypothetical protein